MKALLIFICLAGMLHLKASAQSQPVKNSKVLYPDSEGIDVYPTFTGGQIAFTAFIKKNLHWPTGTKQEGKVVVEFTVEKNGTLSELKVKKSLSRDYDSEALRVVKSTPSWIPGRKLTANGTKPARYRMSLPIVFSVK